MSRAPLQVSNLIDTGRIRIDPNAVQEKLGAASGQYVGASRPFKVSLDKIDDSPYQPRLNYDPVAIQELADSLHRAGQIDPIKLRTKEDGRYELIGGHRRVRAARLLGWTKTDAYIQNVSDQEAQRTTMLDNESRVDLTDIERGHLYAHARELGLASTQQQIAAYFGTSQGRVSKCLALLEEPKPAVKKPERKVGSVITSAAGAPLFVARLAGREMTVRISDPTIDAEAVKAAVMTALKSLAKSESQGKDSDGKSTS